MAMLTGILFRFSSEQNKEDWIKVSSFLFHIHGICEVTSMCCTHITCVVTSMCCLHSTYVSSVILTLEAPIQMR